MPVCQQKPLFNYSRQRLHFVFIAQCLAALDEELQVDGVRSLNVKDVLAGRTEMLKLCSRERKVGLPHVLDGVVMLQAHHSKLLQSGRCSRV